jgi:hypothetical protein
MLPAKFGFIWPSSFRGDFFNSSQSEKRIALGGHVYWPNIYARSSIKHLHLVPFGQQIWPPRAILVSDWLMLNKSPLKLLGQIKPGVSEEKICLTLANQKQELLLAAIFVGQTE